MEQRFLFELRLTKQCEVVLMMNPVKEAEIIESIRSIKDKVIYIYNRHQEAVDSDMVLIRLYKEIFGPIEATDTITRAGRHLRKKFPLLHLRSPEEQQASEDMEEIHRREWGTQ